MRSAPAFAGALLSTKELLLYAPAAAAGAISGRDCFGSWSRRGSHSSQLGRYQLASPRSFIVAGRGTARTIVASIRAAAAGPMPISFLSRSGMGAETADAPPTTRAGAATTPAPRVVA